MRERLENLAFKTAEILNKGGIIVYPTETVYGLGGNALNVRVARRVFQIKGREKGKPLIVLVRDFKMAKKYVDLGIYETALQKYWPGALTGVFKVMVRLAPGVVSKEGTVAVRISPHPFAQKLFEFLDFPLISTSANKSGEASCSSVGSVKISLGSQFRLVDFVVDFGRLPVSKPSTLVDFTTRSPKVLREGSLKFTL